MHGQPQQQPAARIAGRIIPAGWGIVHRARAFTTHPWVALVNWRQVAVLAILVAGSISMAVLQQKEIALVFAGAAAGYATTNNARERHVEPRRGDPS